MGLFSKKVDYDELYRKLSSEKMTPEEARKAEKELKKLAKSGDKRGVIWRPLTSVQIQSVGSVNWATSEFEEAEHKYGICEEYVRVRSLPIVFNLFNESYEKYNDPKGAVFVARAYEHGWGVKKNHGKAVEIIRETENYPKDGTFRLNSDLIKNAYKEITGTEFPDSESSKQKEKQAISDATKNQNEQPQSDINFKRLELDGGDVYEGETRNGKRHGKGKYTWSDGSFYDGEWKDDRKDGNGKQSHPDGTCYDGGWKDDKMDGFGVLVYSNQSRYEGHWSEGTENGHGMLTFANGNSYDGEWKDGNENGHGIKKYINVGVYDGEWKDGDENGHGIMKYINGDVYDGEWKDGDENGHGTMTFANGNRYDGDWVDGDMNGNGIYTYANGEKYKVTCKEGEIVTKAPFETPKTSAAANQSNQNPESEAAPSQPKSEYKLIKIDGGDVFEDYFLNGKKNGHGKYTWVSGSVYDGEWKDGKRSGHGTYTWADGDTYEGEWKNDKRCGRGKLVEYGKSPSGETYMKYSYDGEWLDSKEHGHGICVDGDFSWFKNDKVSEGEWVNGKRQGRFIWYLTNSNGGRYIDFYEDGKWIEGGIPYDERIKTVEDIRRAKGKTSGASENLNHMNMSKIPSWDSVKSGDYSDKVKKETEARRQYIRETVRRLRNPEENASPYYRNIENACMMLAPFMTEAENLFLKGEEEKALKIIEEMLDINIVPDDEWYYNSDTKYFSQFLSGALYSLASQIDFDTPDHDRFIVPAANIACYLWKKYGDYSLFGSVAFLWSETEKDQCGNYLWIERMRDNGDYTVVSKYNESSEYYFGHDLDRYTMGSDCELF